MSNFSPFEIQNNPQFFRKENTSNSYEKPTMMKKVSFDSLPIRQFLIERFDISPGSLVILCATGCSGKTMFMQYLACCVGGNKPMFGQFPVKHGGVVHIDQEQSFAQTNLRYIRLANGLQIEEYDIERTKLKYRLDDSQNLNPDETEKELEDLCKDKILLIVDSLKASSCVDENSAEIEKLLKMFKRVAEKTSCAIIVVHHKGKGKDAKQSGRGHSSIYDSCDVQIDLEVNNEVYELSCAKNREARFFDGIKYQLVDAGEYIQSQHCMEQLQFHLLQDDIKSTKQSQREKIIEALTENEQLKYNGLYDLVLGDKGKFGTVLEAMVEFKEISKVDGPKNSKLYSLSDDFKAAQLWK